MQIKNIVEELCASGSRRRVAYIKSYLALNGVAYNEQQFNSHITNIEVTIEGHDSSKEILFLAHHDIAPQTKEGANDNSSSVAVLLQTACTLQAQRPPCTVRLIFNDTEEILGGLLDRRAGREQIERIITNSGAFHYLKNHPYRNRIEAVYILELSGIGDSLFIAESSANIPCNSELNRGVERDAVTAGYRTTSIPILSSDMIGVSLCGLKGTVFGAVPYHEARAYLDDYRKGGTKKISYHTIPAAWKNMHTSRDNLFAINERALTMIYRTVKAIIDSSVHSMN